MNHQRGGEMDRGIMAEIREAMRIMDAFESRSEDQKRTHELILAACAEHVYGEAGQATEGQERGGSSTRNNY